MTREEILTKISKLENVLQKKGNAGVEGKTRENLMGVLEGFKKDLEEIEEVIGIKHKIVVIEKSIKEPKLPLIAIKKMKVMLPVLKEKLAVLEAAAKDKIESREIQAKKAANEFKNREVLTGELKILETIERLQKVIDLNELPAPQIETLKVRLSIEKNKLDEFKKTYK